MITVGIVFQKCNKESRLLTKVNAENLNGISVDRLRSELELRGNEIVGSATQSALQEISEIVDKCLKTLQSESAPTYICQQSV